MKKILELLLHLSFWVTVIVFHAFIYNITGRNGARSPWTDEFLYHVIFRFLPGYLLTFYGTYFFIIPRYLKTEKYIKLFVALILWLLFTSIIFDVSIMIGKSFSVSNLLRLKDIILGFIIFAVPMSILSFLIWGIVNWFDEHQKAKELKLKTQQIELDLIRSKTNPHFLFNSLNNIDSLIMSDSTKASEYLNKLSDILRYSLYMEDDEKVSLEDEIKIITNFIDLQKLRTLNKEFVTLKIDNNVNIKQTIYPLIFMPFIENAFKHSSDKRAKNAIYINLKNEDNFLLFKCENITTKEKVEPNKIKGIGITLIKQRLNILYPNNTLIINETGHKFIINLRIEI